MRTARAKGCPSPGAVPPRAEERDDPILTGVVVVIPSLFMGSLISSRSSASRAWGYTIRRHQFCRDFPVVRAMVFIGLACSTS